MSPASQLERLLRGARLRAAGSTLLLALPWVAALAVVAWRLDGGAWRWLLPLLPFCAACMSIASAWQRLDRAWLVRALDTRRSDMEDSAALLVGTATPRNTLEALQRERLRARLEARPEVELRAPWNAPKLAANTLAALAILAAALLWPVPHPAPGEADPAGNPGTRTEAAPRLRSQSLRITPPAYTGLPPRSSASLSARVEQGAVLAWTLDFDPQPARVELVFHDGVRLPLVRTGDRWRATRTLSSSALYRIEAPGLAAPRTPWRIDVVRDQPPRIRVLEPARTLSHVVPGQRRWMVAFEATDDHGLAAQARLLVTRTVGSGENITSTAQVIGLRGNGDGKRRRYAHRFDLAALGLVPGDDLIARLEVGDRRAPTAQLARSPSLILRWPPEAGAQATGFDGLVKRAMPAYFRSQRQIIIDAEALLKEKPALGAERFAQRSDALGVDQRLLRLRYGQFLGEESEGGPGLPTNDALPTSDAPQAPAPAAGESPPATTPDAQHSHAEGDAHDHADGENAAPMQRAAGFGEAQQVVERFGHTHDIPEAATLLDPKTRELLRTALNAMWDSEVELRQGQPARALPHAHRALDYIKRVQQAERIYLAKTGVEVAPVDESRRLGGKRDGIASRADPMRAVPAPADPLAAAWQALSPAQGARGAPLDLDALARHLAAHPARGGDPLALAEAIDALRRDPDCTQCRTRLRAQLWPLLQRPRATPAPRAAGDRAGQAYLDALRREQGR